MIMSSILFARRKNYVVSFNANWDIALGLVDGYSAINKFGANPDIDTASDPEDVWDYGGKYTFSTVANINQLSSSSNSDIGDITVLGLYVVVVTNDDDEVKTNWNDISQTVKLNGQTNVFLATNLIRVYRMYNADSNNYDGEIYLCTGNTYSNQVTNAIIEEYSNSYSNQITNIVLDQITNSYSNQVTNIVLDQITNSYSNQVTNIVITNGLPWVTNVYTNTFTNVDAYTNTFTNADAITNFFTNVDYFTNTFTNVDAITNYFTNIDAFTNTFTNSVTNYFTNVDYFTITNSPLTAGVPSVTTNVRAYINDGNNQTLMCVYTIPSGYTGLFISGYVAFTKKTTEGASLSWRARPYGGVFQVKSVLYLLGSGSTSWNYHYGIPPALPEKTDIIIQVDEVGANDTAISGGFDIVLRENKE